MARRLGSVVEAFQGFGPLSSMRSQLGPPSARVSLGTNSRGVMGWPLFSFSQPRDFSLPNSSWGPEMLRLYEQYNRECGKEMEGGEKREGPWRRVPSYNRILKYATGGIYLSEMIHKKARLFTRNNRAQGATFEYVLFFNSEEDKCVGIFQAGHLLEGPPGHVHGGALATMIDTVSGAHALMVCGPVMTANLNINYRSPVPLGNTVLLESSLDKKEGRKIYAKCKMTSSDGSKLHSESTALFVLLDLSKILLRPLHEHAGPPPP